LVLQTMLDRFLAEDSHPTAVSVLPDLLDSIVVYDWITGLRADLLAKRQACTMNTNAGTILASAGSSARIPSPDIYPTLRA